MACPSGLAAFQLEEKFHEATSALPPPPRHTITAVAPEVGPVSAVGTSAAAESFPYAPRLTGTLVATTTRGSVPVPISEGSVSAVPKEETPHPQRINTVNISVCSLEPEISSSSSFQKLFHVKRPRICSEYRFQCAFRGHESIVFTDAKVIYAGIANDF